MSSTLARIEVRVPQELKDQIASLAQARGVSTNEIVVAAIQELLAPGRPATPAQPGMAGVARLERLLEGFVRVFFTVTPPVPEADRQAAAQRGEERFQHLLRLVEEDGA